MFLLTINLDFTKIVFIPLLIRTNFHSTILSVSLLIVTIIKTSHQHTIFYMTHPCQFCALSNSTLNWIYDSTDYWCFPTSTSSSCHCSISSLTLIDAPSYRLVTDFTALSTQALFVIFCHKAFSRFTRQNLLSLVHSIICLFSRHKCELHMITSCCFTEYFFQHLFHHLHTILHRSFATDVHYISLPFENWNHSTFGLLSQQSNL